MSRLKEHSEKIFGGIAAAGAIVGLVAAGDYSQTQSEIDRKLAGAGVYNPTSEQLGEANETINTIDSQIVGKLNAGYYNDAKDIIDQNRKPRSQAQEVVDQPTVYDGTRDRLAGSSSYRSRLAIDGLGAATGIVFLVGGAAGATRGVERPPRAARPSRRG